MPAPSDPRLLLGTVADSAAASSRSHLSDGRCVGWFGEAGAVVDAELYRPVPPALARRYGAERFWERWTLAECRAKAADVPIGRWLRRHGLDHDGGVTGEVRALRIGDVVVTVLHPRSGDG